MTNAYHVDSGSNFFEFVVQLCKLDFNVSTFSPDFVNPLESKLTFKSVKPFRKAFEASNSPLATSLPMNVLNSSKIFILNSLVHFHLVVALFFHLCLNLCFFAFFLLFSWYSACCGEKLLLQLCHFHFFENLSSTWFDFSAVSRSA